MVLCQVCDIPYLTENLKNKVYFKYSKFVLSRGRFLLFQELHFVKAFIVSFRILE